MSAWVLLMVLLTAADGFGTSYKLNNFDTYEECSIERNRIGFDMAEAYPADLDFRIECHEKVTPLVADNKINYTEAIRKWADMRHPGDPYTVEVRLVKDILSENNIIPKDSRAFLVILTYKTGSEAFILLIASNEIGVFGWIPQPVPDPVEEEEPEEVFSFKDQA